MLVLDFYKSGNARPDSILELEAHEYPKHEINKKSMEISTKILKNPLTKSAKMRRKLKRKATFSHSDKVTTLFETFSAILNLKFDFIFHASQFLRSFWSLKLMLDTRSQLLEARKTKLIDTRLDSILEKQKICASDTRKFDTRTPPTFELIFNHFWTIFDKH